MKTLRDYEALIRAKVEEINKDDKNWTWTVKSFAKDRVRIRWSYLDYLQEKDNCFILELTLSPVDSHEYVIVSRTPEGTMITGDTVSDNEIFKPYQVTFEDAIRRSIQSTANYAHSRY